MQRGVVVQCGVHGARTQPVRNGPQAHLPKRRAQGKTKQRYRGGQNAQSRHQAGAQLVGDEVGKQAGNNGGAGYCHGQNACGGNGRVQFCRNNRPRRPQKRIRQAQTDKSQEDYCNKQTKHQSIPLRRFLLNHYRTKTRRCQRPHGFCLRKRFVRRTVPRQISRSGVETDQT